MEFVIGGILYFILLVTLGIITIRKGHWVMFIIDLHPAVLDHRRADAAEGPRVASLARERGVDLVGHVLAGAHGGLHVAGPISGVFGPAQ